MCEHTPRCPGAEATDYARAHVLADHSEQGWVSLCNGVVLFDDGLCLMPDGRVGATGHLVP